MTVRRALLACAVVMAVAPSTAGAASLDARIEHLIARSQFAGARTGLAVYDRTTGRFLAMHNGRAQLRPGSNVKLATSAALFVEFGPSARLKTRIMASGPLAAGTVTGSLFFVGAGDPSLATRAYARAVHSGGGTLVRDVAAAVAHRGISRVTGRLYGDESAFDSRRTGPLWKPSYWQDCAPISALSVNEDLFHPGRPQSSSNPPLFAAQILKKSLRNRGVAFQKAPRVRVHPGTAWVVATTSSPRISRLVRQMDLPSDNYYAEVLTKALAVHAGLRGTTANGTLTTRRSLRRLGVKLRGASLFDGSGLSLGDHLSTRQIISILRRSAQQRWGPHLHAALPVAGVSGTLRDRMRTGPAHGNAHAKTGTLNTASALSGYVRSANGHRIVFSIIQNRRPRLDVLAAHRLQDSIVQLLAGSNI
jgi:D-alanyl-D-alanine carboxypeptidase/D-alanyl-D-alanine-endopeptidase (penicillin-binding protein 4)